MSPVLLSLVRKDLRLFFSDRRSVILSFVVPIALASFMGAVTGGKGSDKVNRVSVLTVDQDQTELSAKVMKNLAGDPGLEAAVSELAPARSLVRNGKVPVAIVIPKGFAESSARAFFGSGERPVVTLFTDPSHATEASMVRGILTQHVMQAVSTAAFNGHQGAETIDSLLADVEDAGAVGDPALRDMLSGISRWQHQQATQPKPAPNEETEKGGLQIPFETRVEALAAEQGESYDGYAHSFGGMGIQFVLFASIDCAVALLTERQRGLWRRLRAAPLSRSMLLLSRAISGAIIGALILLALFGFGAVVFHIQVSGSLLGLLMVCTAFALMASTFGLLVASLGKTPQAARGLSVFAVLVMVMLGGAWFPAFLFPTSVQKLTLFAPTRWAMDGIDAMTWRGLGLEAAVLPTLALLGFSVLLGTLAVSRFRWEAD